MCGLLVIINKIKWNLSLPLSSPPPSLVKQPVIYNKLAITPSRGLPVLLKLHWISTSLPLRLLAALSTLVEALPPVVMHRKQPVICNKLATTPSRGLPVLLKLHWICTSLLLRLLAALSTLVEVVQTLSLDLSLPWLWQFTPPRSEELIHSEDVHGEKYLLGRWWATAHLGLKALSARIRVLLKIDLTKVPYKYNLFLPPAPFVYIFLFAILNPKAPSSRWAFRAYPH